MLTYFVAPLGLIRLDLAKALGELFQLRRCTIQLTLSLGYSVPALHDGGFKIFKKKIEVPLGIQVVEFNAECLTKPE